MIKSKREAFILDLLVQRSPRSIADLAKEIAGVSAVSIRRDVARLGELGALERTHGGARARTSALPHEDSSDGGLDGLDAIILPPVEGRSIDTLRHLARRRALFHPGVEPQGRLHRLHQTDRQPIQHRNHAPRRLRRAPSVLQFSGGRPDLGAQRPRFDVFPGNIRRRLAFVDC